MSVSDLLHTIKDGIIDYKFQVVCLAVSTLAYQGYRTWQQKNTPEAGKVTRRKSRDKVKYLGKTQNLISIPESVLNSGNSLVEQVQHLYNPACKITKVPHLFIELRLSNIPIIKSPLIGGNRYKSLFGGQGFLPKESFVYRGSFVLEKNTFYGTAQLMNPVEWLLAGPRKFLHFEPSQVRAAIVTCGGLCPGLNVVIRQIFSTLSMLYGCPQVWGVLFGFMGFYSGDQYWKRLDERFVRDLQYSGGTILGSSRGGFDGEKIVDEIVRRKINQVYIIGGDGTHRGIMALTEEVKKRKLEISIVGVPKTIDNDIPIIDKSFGFETAVSQSLRAIRSALVESLGVQYGIGLVRLMGRDAGFIAMEATNGSRDVDICLIPQFPFDLYGPDGVLSYIYDQLKIRKHLVIVVAEGAGRGVRDVASLKEAVTKDGSGNTIRSDIGQFLKTEIVKYCEIRKLKATLKYIDPAYMIRTVPANAYDRKMCAHLAASAVHGAMAGFTAFTVGHINQYVAMIPISSLTEPNRVTKGNRSWMRLLAYTGQPSFLNDPKDLEGERATQNQMH